VILFAKLENKKPGFKVKYVGWKRGPMDDEELFLQEREESFSFDGMKVTRIPPIGPNISQSTYEWLDMEWDEAVQFSRGDLTALKNWHSERQKLIRGRFDKVLKCPNRKSQVLTMQSEDKKKTYFFR